MKAFFMNLWHAHVRARNRKRRWAERTTYTYKPSPDDRDTLRFWRNSWRS